VEVWKDGTLAGGLYGVQTEYCFSGESMFTLVSDASKVALVWLCDYLLHEGVPMIDCQMTTPHLVRFGAVEISRDEYLWRLQTGEA